MPGTIGRAFKISSKQAKSYGYARPNPGVTAIAAVNGRGSYTARTAMTGRSAAGRLSHARNATRRQLSAADRAAFAKRMRDARQRKMTGNMSRSAAGKKNIKRAIATRKAWGRSLQRGHRYRVGAAAYGKSPGAAKKLSPGVYTANRRTRMLRKNRTTARRRGRVLRKSRKARRMTSNPKARRTTRRRRKKTTAAAAPKRRRRVKRRRKATARKTPVRRRRRRKAKASSATPKRRRRVKRKSRKASARKSPVRRRRRRKAKASSAAPKRRRRVKRRKGRKAKAMSPNRRRRVKHRRNRRRSGRRLGMFRRNQGFMTTLKEGAKVGLIVFAGVAAHKAATKLLTELVLDKFLGAAATPATPPAPAAVSGLEVLQPYKKIIAGIAVAGLGSFAANAVIKDQETKKYAIAGMWGSLLHTVIVDLLAAFGGATGGKVAQYLSGYDDSTAYSLGASIMPMYRPVGEYFDQGMGEYFEGATAGLGNYGMNGDIYQAQAGYGAMPDSNSGHIDPSSDLDRELTLAEAAAGVGALPSYEAAAGLGDFIGNGHKAIGSRSTWIPGETNPGTWAPVTSVSRGQAATAMVPAGILQTGGGSGVFG
jgi:hypothetical protein